MLPSLQVEHVCQQQRNVIARLFCGNQTWITCPRSNSAFSFENKMSEFFVQHPLQIPSNRYVLLLLLYEFHVVMSLGVFSCPGSSYNCIRILLFMIHVNMYVFVFVFLGNLMSRISMNLYFFAFLWSWCECARLVDIAICTIYISVLQKSLLII